MGASIVGVSTVGGCIVGVCTVGMSTVGGCIVGVSIVGASIVGVSTVCGSLSATRNDCVLLISHLFLFSVHFAVPSSKPNPSENKLPEGFFDDPKLDAKVSPHA